MNHDKKPKQILEEAAGALRSDQPQQEIIQAAGERVWQRLSQELTGPATDMLSIRGCEDVRSLLPQYRKGSLGQARALLVEDHLRECVACRKQAENGASARTTLLPWKQELPKAGYMNLRWATAAIVLLALGISSYFVIQRFSNPPGVRAQVESVDGALYRVGTTGEQLLAPGAELGEGEKVRSAGGTRAKLRLRDGSIVEMNERAEVSFSLGYRDTTINLGRGNIIVQAAKRHSGHLYVAAKDCRVSVTGTVFSVNSGIKGSRVSVIEGEVRVAHLGATAVLHPGDQLATNDSVAKVPVQQEIAWSQDRDKHLALLAEFAHLSNVLQQVQMPGLRYQSHLLPLLSQNTMLYAGVPNLADALHQADQLFKQELQASPVLNEWWQKVQSQKNAPNFDKAVGEIQQLGRYVGDEILFSISSDGNERAVPLVIAEVRTPGLKQFIEQEIAEYQKQDATSDVHVLEEGDLAAATGNRGLYILVRPDYVAASSNVAALQAFNSAINGGSGFAATPFGQRMAAAYQTGAGLLFGVDLERIEQHRTYVGGRRNVAFERSGFADLRFLVAERKDLGGQTYNHAELAFTGPRHGIASWLAAPASIGGLDYVSKDAGAVAAFVSKKPVDMLDDVLSMASGPDGDRDLRKVEADLNIDIRHDLAEALGGEITFAFDGPLLPTPSWKVIVEVYDPGRLQTTLQRLVDDFNSHKETADKGTLKIEQQADGGLNYYTLYLSGGTQPFEMTYTFTEGYMIVAPNKAMVMNAIRVHQTGNSLANSQDFHNLLPQDNHANVSALIYQNLAPVVGPILSQLTPSQQQSFQRLAAETKPSVVCAYGDDNAIQVASNSRFFGMDLNTLALSTLMQIAQGRGRHE